MNTFHRLVITCLSIAAPAGAASLKQAEFTRVINDVQLIPAQQQPVTAKIGDQITGRTAVSTGVASRAELRFPDKTLTRIGANSVFKLDQADRTVTLEQGVILLQVPKQIGGAKVRTGAVTAAVTGTSVMVERTPDGFIKVIVLEGEVDLYFNDNPSNVITLVPGDILIFREDAEQFPLPAKVDLELLQKTSKLMDPTVFDPLINQKHLADALDQQNELKNKGELLKTAFEIMGRGTQITLTSRARQEIFNTLVLQNRISGNQAPPGNAPPPSSGNGNGPPPPSGNGTTARNATASGNNNNQTGNAPSDTPPPPTGIPPTQPILNAGTTVFGNGSSIVTNPHATAFNSVANGVATMQGTIYKPASDGKFNTYMYGDAQTFPDIDTVVASRGNWFAFKGDALYISGDISVDSASGPRNLILGAINDVIFSFYPPYDLTTDGSWTLPASVDALLISSQHGSIKMDSSFTLYGSGLPQEVSFYAYGPTSDVRIEGPGGGYLDVSSQFGDGGYLTNEGPAFANIDLPYGSFQAYAEHDITLTNGAVVNAGEVALTAGGNVTIGKDPTDGSDSTTIRAKTSLRINALGNIKIQNSSQLLALSGVDPLSILLKAEGANGTDGNIDIINSSMDATSVEMVSANGNISISNDYPGYLQIAADVIKARVMSTGGELHVNNGTLGRSTPAATSLIKLYGEGASGVRFSGDNTLNANSVDIAGQTVTIDTGGRVKLHNPSGSRVWTDVPNFNNGTHGNFTASDGTTLYNPHAPLGMGFGAKPTY